MIWLDAHGDLNRPSTTPSGNVHGMVLAAALGLAGDGFASDQWPTRWVDVSRAAIVGARSLDPGERELVREHGIRVWTMSHIDRLGLERVMREAIEHVSGDNFVHVSLDMDALDRSSRRVSGRRSAAASTTARRTSPSSSSPRRRCSARSTSSR